MKSTGIVRKIDDLGRIVIPKEIRRTFNISNYDPMEIFIDGDMILFKKFSTACVFCASQENLELFKEKSVCPDCLKDIRK